MSAALGLAVGAAAAAHGPLFVLTDRLTTVAGGVSPSLASVLEVPRWALIGALVTLIALALARWAPAPAESVWSPGRTGLAVGGIGVLAWITGAFADWPWGLSIIGPSRSLVETTVLGMPSAARWGTMMLVGIPVGAWLGARVRGRAAWRSTSVGEKARRFTGGVLMGVGGTLAAGCNIGNALTGVSVLAVNSLVATAGIAAGGMVAVGIAGVVSGIPFARRGLPLMKEAR